MIVEPRTKRERRRSFPCILWKNLSKNFCENFCEHALFQAPQAPGKCPSSKNFPPPPCPWNLCGTYGERRVPPIPCRAPALNGRQVPPPGSTHGLGWPPPSQQAKARPNASARAQRCAADVVYRLAWPLAPLDRSPFLELVAQRLQEQTTVSDGTVHRIAVECQRRFFAPPPAPDRG